eukprot:364135-Chlamydomonas_euryale.AAC.1
MVVMWGVSTRDQGSRSIAPLVDSDLRPPSATAPLFRRPHAHRPFSQASCASFVACLMRTVLFRRPHAHRPFSQASCAPSFFAGLMRTVLEAQETRGLTRSDDISRLLPSEAAMLARGRQVRSSARRRGRLHPHAHTHTFLPYVREGQPRVAYLCASVRTALQSVASRHFLHPGMVETVWNAAGMSDTLWDGFPLLPPCPSSTGTSRAPPEMGSAPPLLAQACSGHLLGWVPH